MALDRTVLEKDLKAMSKKAAEQKWNPDQTMAELAAVIDRFVRGAVVTGVEVTVQGVPHKQTRNGSLT